MENVKQYIEENKDRFLEELFELIRIPSISSLSEHKDDMTRAANYWKEAMLKAGADKAEVMPTEGNPVVYGEKIIDASKLRLWFMAIMMLCRLTRLTCGRVNLLSRKSGMKKFMPAVPMTTKDNHLCMPKHLNTW